MFCHNELALVYCQCEGFALLGTYFFATTLTVRNYVESWIVNED